MKKIIIITLWLVPSLAWAEWSGPTPILNESSLVPLEVKWIWNKEDRQKAYSSGELFRSFGYDSVTTLLFETPFSGAIRLIGKTESMSDSDAGKISKFCKKYDNPWQRIACAAKNINSYYRVNKFPDYTKFCRAHAQSFLEVFKDLDLPRAKAELVGANFTKEGKSIGHMANRLIVTDINGSTYSYIIDVGWFPGSIFADNSLAQKYHDQNSDGKFDSIFLPKLPLRKDEIKYYFRPRPSNSEKRPGAK